MFASLLCKVRAAFESETFRLGLFCTDLAVYKVSFLPLKSAL